MLCNFLRDNHHPVAHVLCRAYAPDLPLIPDFDSPMFSQPHAIPHYQAPSLSTEPTPTHGDSAAPCGKHTCLPQIPVY